MTLNIFQFVGPALAHFLNSDQTVISFHGVDTVRQYILTLINIVSAIYGDPTLGANLKFVILRMIFYEGNQTQVILVFCFCL